MSPADLQTIVGCLSRMASIYRQPLADAELETYVKLLVPYGGQAVAKACEAILSDPDAPGWYPRPNEIILRITGSRKRAAALAWHKFRTGISQYAGFTVAFDDPLIHYVAQRTGGWSRLGQGTTYALDKLREDFIEHYAEALENPPPADQVPRLMVGEDNPGPNRAIPIGDRSKVAEVVSGDLNAAIKAITFKPAAAAVRAHQEALR